MHLKSFEVIVTYHFKLLCMLTMVLSVYAKMRILSLHQKGCRVSFIAECLVMEDGIVVSKQGIRQFLKRYKDCGTISRKPGSGCTIKMLPMIEQIIERAMQEDDETTATQLQAKLADNGIYISLATILRNRRLLGWVYRGSAYCQLIRTVNKEKRLEWARENQTDAFDDVIWSDETSVQLDTHRRFCCRKEGMKPRPKPRPKHPIKVHVWAGISKKGATGVCIFEGKMDATLYCEILRQTLLPFIQARFPTPMSHRFMQDNDPKHCSRQAQRFYEEVGINWW